MILRPAIIAPDTSHWSQWIDAALSSDLARREPARALHRRLLEQGRIPFLSWHHLQELLCHENDTKARARIAFLQDLPMIAWMRPAGDRPGLGSIVDILTEEVVACHSGCTEVMQVRDRVKARLIRTGPGVDAVGSENWVWEVARPIMMEQRRKTGMIAAIGGIRFSDESQTIAQVAAQGPRPIGDRNRVLAGMHANIMREALQADPRRTSDEARWMADEFLASSAKWLPDGEVSSRSYTVALYVMAGLDPEDVRDECTMEQLSTLATFRQHLRIVARNADVPFERLKQTNMDLLPSRRIIEGLKRWGQRRAKRPGSDVHDQYLAVLAAYTDTLYVDRRTRADLDSVVRKDRRTASLFGEICTASRFTGLA